MTFRYIAVQGVTAFRVVCAGFIPVLAINGVWPVMTFMLAVAFISDFFDGWLARRWKATSSFGAFFDPLADKIICLAMLWLLAAHYQSLAYIALAIAVTAYDITTTTLRLTRAKKQSMPASRVAKLKTALLMTGLLLAPVGIGLEQTAAATIVSNISLFMLAIAAGISLFSLGGYLRAIVSPLKTQLEFHDHMNDINFVEWNNNHAITTVLLDIDGTLAPWRSSVVGNETKTALQRMRQSGITRIGLVTNMSGRHEQKIKQMAREVGADMYIFPRAWRYRKPSSQMIHSALNQLNASPETTAFIGDKVVDALAARRAKLACVAWVEKLGADHPLDKYLYRPLEPALKWLLR